MEKKDAIREMRSRSRDIITGDFAVQIAEAFDVDKEDLPIRVFTVEGGLAERAIVHTEGDGIGVCTLSSLLAKMVTGDAVSFGPYMGTGRNAEYVTYENCKLLEEALNV